MAGKAAYVGERPVSGGDARLPSGRLVPGILPVLMISWRTQWFINLLMFELVMGRAIQVPFVPQTAFSLIVWAVLGWKSGLKFWILSDILDWRWWQTQLAGFQTIFPIVQDASNLIAAKQSGNYTAVIQVANQLNATLPHIPQFIPKGAIFPIDGALLLFLVPFSIWLTLRRVRAIRKRTKPVVQRLP